MTESLPQLIENEAVAAAIALAIEREPTALLDTARPNDTPSPWGLAGRLAQLNRVPRGRWR
ncbi:MAG: hypothetical protein AB7V27_06185 [Candidatus Binatia bacterium]